MTGAALAAPHALFAQSTTKVYRIATLDDAVEGTRAERWKLLKELK